MSLKLSKQHFWLWFREHNREYLSLNTKSQKDIRYWTNELTAHLRAYYKFLYFSISTTNDHTTGVLTISVAGKEQYFKYVDRLTAVAPAIPDWRVQALEAPMPIDFLWEHEHGDTGVDPHDFWCLVPEGGYKPDIEIYHRLYTEDRQRAFRAAAEGALYNVLGERAFGRNIGVISVANLSTAPKGELIKLKKLPAYMITEVSGLAVDAMGRMWEQ
jgi:hypothetical protein